ncbi:MAG TPA: asparagine synthase (glutamine-hydrolyzing), partial [Planctomycetes bacterium]|nr:asparagine synthase (glutamine-hydrolyzing) [Planctomycetota bacterium]
MCGIAGIARVGEPDPEDERRVQAMVDALAHRGPDGEGVERLGPVVLGHRRLAILDLSERGRQPMRAGLAPADVALSYNGEVYNHEALRGELAAAGHAFLSRTDTETVLRGWVEWGEALFARLNGMFGLALWDERDQSLTLARDPFGQKAVYYAELPEGGLAFASELGPLEGLLRELGELRLDRRAVAKFLCFDGLPRSESVLARVRKLPPASTLRWRPGSAPVVTSYWRRDYTPPRPLPSPRAAADELWRLLCRSVERHLMSDVPLGLFLSGGVDSSAILAAMASVTDPARIQTFSIGFREAGYDESDAAAQVARAFGVRHRVRVLDEPALLELLPQVLDHLDEPLADASIVPTYALSRFAREHVTVALGGDGGDELFAGYDTTVAERLARVYLRAPGLLRRAVAAGVRRLPTSADKRSLQFRATRFVAGLRPDPLVRNQRWFGSFQPEEAAALVLGEDSPAALYEDLAALDAPSGEQAALELWTAIFLPDCVLTKVDRASMAVSLEVRAPFLDTEFARYALSLPYRYKLRGLARKWILKRALEGRLPESILRRSKQGFGVPNGEWLRGPLRAEAERQMS